MIKLQLISNAQTRVLLLEDALAARFIGARNNVDVSLVIEEASKLGIRMAVEITKDETLEKTQDAVCKVWDEWYPKREFIKQFRPTPGRGIADQKTEAGEP